MDARRPHAGLSDLLDLTIPPVGVVEGRVFSAEASRS